MPCLTALITISTRASLKKFHTYNLTLGLGADGAGWEFDRIGTEKEKMGVQKELAELRERLSRVEEWKGRRDAIDAELSRVWVQGGDELAPPPYIDGDKTTEQNAENEEGSTEAVGPTP